MRIVVHELLEDPSLGTTGLNSKQEAIIQDNTHDLYNIADVGFRMNFKKGTS